jgi:K+-sensing histidine kinase KdpD
MEANLAFNANTRLEKLTRLVEVSLVLNSTLELEPLLQHIMNAAAELAEAASASILLMDENTQQLQFMAFATGGAVVGKTLKRVPIPIKNSLAGTCLVENRPVVVNDVADYPSHYRKADDTTGFQTRSLLAIPMRLRDRVIGVLEAVNKHNNAVWTEGDIYCLEILASQAAVAVENSGLIARLRDAYDELSKLDKMKMDFIAIASHELRTPLGVVLGYASFLKDEAQGEASNHATAVLDSAMKMRQIIDDMMHLRYLGIGENELNLSTVSMSEIMIAAMSAVQPKTATRGHRLHYTVPPTDVIVNADTMMAQIALANVLDNAIKFSPENTFIEMTYEQHDHEIWIKVVDEGIGLEKEQLERIFKTFYQVEDHMTRRQGGMGLGLAITKAIVEAHHGRVWVQSPGLNLGSTFYVCFPFISG